MKNFIRVITAFILFAGMAFLSGCREKGIPAGTKDTIDKYVGYWNSGKFDGIENILCNDFELLESPLFEPQKGIESFKQSITEMRTSYPDFHLVIDEMVYEKNKIALIWTISATNTGYGKRPPTGKTIRGQGISVIHIKDGWLASNNLLWMTQLGFTFVPPGDVNIK